MECLRYFAEGYRVISVISEEDDDSYQNVKQDLDDMKVWKTLKEETRIKVIEIRMFFENYLKNAKETDAEAVVKKAQEFGKLMDEYRKKIYKIDASVDVNPKKIDARISLLKERIERIEVHGTRLGIACIAILAGLAAIAAWQIYGPKAVKIVLGGAVGLAGGILIFLIIYHSILALEKKHLSRWKELKKDIEDCLEMVADIEKKRPIASDIATLLTDGVEIERVNASKQIINQCEKFLAD